MTHDEILLIDVGTGNLRSVEKALRALGAQVKVTSHPDDLAGGRHIVLPGVGAFASFMQGLKKDGLDMAVKECVQRGNLLLGICVGMQAFFEASQEMGTHPGLGLLCGQVLHFTDALLDQNHAGRHEALKIPHTGWNQLLPQASSPLLEGIAPGSYAYFNHSYYCAAALEDITALTDYGLPFASVVQRANVFGVQFHPEKSQRVGLRVLSNFMAL